MMVKSSTVTGRLEQLLNGEGQIMSANLKKLLEGVKTELEKRCVRKNVKVLTLVRKYRPTASKRDRVIIRNQILPAIGKLNVSQVDVNKFIESHRHKPVGSAQKIFRCFRNIMQIHDPSFELPKVTFTNPGRQWTADHILEEAQVLDVIHNHVFPKYQLPCLIAAYSGLRLKNVAELKRSEIDLKKGWINLKRQSKTKKPFRFPIGKKLEKILRLAISEKKIIAMGEEGDYNLFNLNRKTMSNCVRKSFHRAGFPEHSFHSFRHWFACHAVNNGVPLAVLRELMGHSDFKYTLVYARVNEAKLKEAVEVFG